MLRTESAGSELAYATQGGSGPKVLLVMGLGMRGLVWGPQIDDLSRDHQVAWFDHRGIGDSAPVKAAFRIEDLAGDAVAVLDALGWRQAHVVGVSLGGMVAQEIALGFPGRVRSLTLIATHPGGPLGVLPEPRGALRFAQSLVWRKPEAMAELLYPASFLRHVNHDALQERMRAQFGRRQSRRTLAYQLGAVVRHDTRSRLGQLGVPTVVVKPGADILVRPFHSDELARLIPGAQLLELAEAGHGVTFQCAREVNAAVRDLVARVA